MKSLIVTIGLLASASGCYALWSGASALSDAGRIEAMARAERTAALAPIRRLMADAVTLDPQTGTPPAPGTKVMISGSLVAAAEATDPELGVTRPGALALVRDVARYDLHRTMVERQERIPATPVNQYRFDRYRTVREPKVEASWQPIHQSSAGFPLVTRRFPVRVRVGRWPMSPALAEQIGANGGVSLTEASRQRVARLTPRPVRLENGRLFIGASARPAEDDLRIVVSEVRAGTYTILAAWNGQELDLWQDPDDGARSAIVRPGGPDDLIPPSFREEAVPQSGWLQRLDARRDLALQMGGGGVLALVGFAAVGFGWSRRSASAGSGGDR